MIKIRKKSKAVCVYNEGLVVFIYDKANGKIIQKADPSILEGFSDADAEDPRLVELSSKGMLVVYELDQDDELSIEVTVGSPLTEEELSNGRWHPVQKALISAPSGKVCIEGYCNLRLSPDFDPDEEPGAVVKVPKGDYVLSLYRINWVSLEEDGILDDSMDWEGPNQVIVFTPVSEAEKIPQVVSMLRM